MTWDERLPKIQTYLDVIAALAVTCFAVAATVTTVGRTNGRADLDGPATTPDPKPAVLAARPISISKVPMKGSPMAKVAMAVFSDFECPFCATFATKTMPVLEKQYVENAQLAILFKHFPNANIHKRAMPAALFAECANTRGRFWEMHDALFSMSKSLAPMLIAKNLADSGLKGAEFAACVGDNSRAVVERDLAEGRSLKVVGTPTFFLGRIRDGSTLDVVERFSGARSVDFFKERIEALKNAIPQTEK